MLGEIVGEITNSRGRYTIRMYTLRHFLDALQAHQGNPYMQVAYLSAMSIDVPLEEFLEWSMPDAEPVLTRVSEAFKKLKF